MECICRRVVGRVTPGASVGATIQGGGVISATVAAATAAAAAIYGGPYDVTPTRYAQTLETNGKRMAGDVTVNPIPSYYGLITYNGSVLTVS